MIPRTPAVLIGETTHNRLTEPGRRFTRPMLMAMLDLDSLPNQLDGLPLWSARNRSWVRMRNRDFLDGSDQPLAPRVRGRVADELGWAPEGPVHMLANLRTGGWLFNPLTLYFAYTDSGNVGAVVAEVTNTPWHQRTWYVIDAHGGRAGETHRSGADKAMHVSPFLPMDMQYSFAWVPPGAGFHFTISARREDRTQFTADLRGDFVPLDAASAARVVLRHPLAPLHVSAGIYAHAAVLAARRANFYSHPDRAGLTSPTSDIRVEPPLPPVGGAVA